MGIGNAFQLTGLPRSCMTVHHGCTLFSVLLLLAKQLHSI